MKTTLFLSAFAAGVLTMSTATFAQSFGNYAQAVGEPAATQTFAPRDLAPVDRFSRSDLGYQANAGAPRHKAKHHTQTQTQEQQ
jgi:hypothetical protein